MTVRERAAQATMKKAWKWGFVGAAVVLLSLFGCGVFPVWERSRAIDGGMAVASRFLAALNAHQYEAAHAMLTEDQKRAVSVASVREAEERVEKKHGKPIGKPTNDEYHPNDALDHVTYFYDTPLSPSDDTWIMVRTAHTPDGWRVCEYHYDYSPA